MNLVYLQYSGFDHIISQQSYKTIVGRMKRISQWNQTGWASGKALDLHLRNAQFKFWLGHQLP
jgi:hypothetical protein